MKTQTQFLFEAPLSFETTNIAHPYIQYKFKENEWELYEAPQGSFGQLAFGLPGQTPRFSYTFTPEDTLWLARFIVGEAGGKDNLDNRAVIWAMFNRYALFTHKVKQYNQFHKFIRSYSTPLQPTLNSARAAERHINDPTFVKTGGFYKPPNDHIPKGQLKRFLDLQKTPWQKLPSSARSLAERALKGQIPNPGIGIASEFANTFVYFKQAHKRPPNAQEWRQYTEALARQKGWIWIGDVPKLNQVRQNAFFVDKRVKNLPSNTVQIHQGTGSNRPASSSSGIIDPQPGDYADIAREILRKRNRNQGIVLSVVQVKPTDGKAMIDTQTERGKWRPRLKNPPAHVVMPAEIYEIKWKRMKLQYVWILSSEKSKFPVGGVLFLPLKNQVDFYLVTFNTGILDDSNCTNIHHAEMQAVRWIEEQPRPWRSRIGSISIWNLSRKTGLGYSSCNACCVDLARFLTHLRALAPTTARRASITWLQLYDRNKACGHPTDTANLRKLASSGWVLNSPGWPPGQSSPSSTPSRVRVAR